jgi:dihydroorotate dehydrogenase electron transfer subunit
MQCVADKMHVPKVIEIKKIIKESDSVKTFIFDWDIDSETDKVLPGQFMMLWNFQDEKPMSISLIDPINGELGISIKEVGEFTRQVHSLKEGDKLGLRGPYGNGFELKGSKILAVGGGIGMAPVAAFVDYAIHCGVSVDVVSASLTETELLFVDRMKNSGAQVFTCTDDGTCGFQGFATDRVEGLLTGGHYDMLVTCGPELMMKGICDMVEDREIPTQFSMERYMKCAMGLCGQCCVDNTGWRICVEGPVFWDHELKKVTEFGKYRRDASGTRIHF